MHAGQSLFNFMKLFSRNNKAIDFKSNKANVLSKITYFHSCCCDIISHDTLKYGHLIVLCTFDS